MRRRVVPPPQGKVAANHPLLTATKEQLIERVKDFSDPIQSFSMTADFSASVGALYGGEVTDYASIRGYILFKRPDDIRIIGLDPVIRSKAFDMVSTGNTFKLLIPSKNLLIEGRNDEVRANSKSKLENLRPAAFLNSLMILPPNPQTDITVIEDDTDEMHAQYRLIIVEHSQEQYHLVRSLYFDRTDLQLARQRTFDLTGAILSDTKYRSWKDFNGHPYPSDIDIERPEEGYEVQLSVVDIKMNTDIPPQQFALNPPPNVQVQQLH